MGKKGKKKGGDSAGGGGDPGASGSRGGQDSGPPPGRQGQGDGRAQQAQGGAGARQQPPQQHQPQPQQSAPRDGQQQRGPPPGGAGRSQPQQGDSQRQQPGDRGQQRGPQQGGRGQRAGQPQGFAQQEQSVGPPPGLQQQGPPRQGAWGQQQAPPPQQAGFSQQQQSVGPPPGLQQQGPPRQGAWGQQHVPPSQLQQPLPPQQQAAFQQPGGGPPPGLPRGPPQQEARERGQHQPRPQGGQQRGPPPAQAQLPSQPQPQQRQQQPRGESGQQRPPQQRGPQSPPAPPTAEVARISVSGAGDKNLVSLSRKKPGTQGRIIKVESNHLQLNLGSLRVAYHYDVTFIPDTPKKFMRPVFEIFRRQNFPNIHPAFDGRRNIYTTTPLTSNLGDGKESEVVITDEDGREKKFKVQIKFANEVDLTPLRNFLNSPATPQEALQVVDIVLRMAPVSTCYPLGRSFFMKPENNIIDLGEGMEMYHGFYQSAIRGWKPLLNVDVAHKAFPQNICVVDALCQLLSTGRNEFRREDLRSLRDDQQEKLLKYIRTLRVAYEIPGVAGSRKHYRVNGLGSSATRATFTHDNQQMNILSYFQRFKNYRLRYPDLPTLWVGNPQRPDRILLPMELCTIVEGQGVNRKMTETQTSNMIRYAATNTAVRKQKIERGIQRANYNQNPCVKEFGFSVGHEFQKLDARVLTPPELQYAKNTAKVFKGVWRSSTFLQPVTINNWTIVSCCPRYPPRPDDFTRLATMFPTSGRDVGMNFANRATEPFINIPGRQSYGDIENYFRGQKGKFDVIFVVVPDSGPQYSFVKKASELAVGCLTQCLKQTTLARRMNPQTAGNILLKVNSKLNGINHTFSRASKPQILQRPVMIMGADVTHPGPDAQDIPSVAAVTASHDPKAFQYNICWRLQNPKMEIIEDLEAITEEHLKFFYEKTRVKPEAIIFFRDGVSEGQFEQVKNEEIRAIRAACKKMQRDGFEPKITFLVVQKRHHTRLFPMNPRDSEDKNCNVPAGTCVDTDITHPFLQDFYLVSHASIQGVAKPTKYCTLWDDNNMDNDTVEQLSYYLCHMFSRCNRSVSYPAPTYYAHLAAARAKVYIETENRLDMSRLREEFKRFKIRDEIRKDLPMFFV